MKNSRLKDTSNALQSNFTSQNSLFINDNAASLSRSLQSLGGLGKPTSAVLRLSPCISNLAKAIGMVISFKVFRTVYFIFYFQDDAFAAAANVSKLTRLLDASTSTSENHYNACVILHKLAEREASRNSLAYYPQAIFFSGNIMFYLLLLDNREFSPLIADNAGYKCSNRGCNGFTEFVLR